MKKIVEAKIEELITLESKLIQEEEFCMVEYVESQLSVLYEIEREYEEMEKSKVPTLKLALEEINLPTTIDTNKLFSSNDYTKPVTREQLEKLISKINDRMFYMGYKDVDDVEYDWLGSCKGRARNIFDGIK